MKLRLSPANIEEASHIIDQTFTCSPQFSVDSINDQLGHKLICKVETLNPIRSFKGRGASYFIHKLEKDVDWLVCASAGNFGQGMAYVARNRGLRLTVFAAETANPLKIERMRQLNAEVVIVGHDFDAAKEAAQDYAQKNGVRFVEDGRDIAIAEGAGTIGIELSRWPKPFDAVLIPLGDGSLLTGIGCWLKQSVLRLASSGSAPRVRQPLSFHGAQAELLPPKVSRQLPMESRPGTRSKKRLRTCDWLQMMCSWSPINSS
jgi:threonine dehydratase